jgi:hypothetical protein
MGPGRQRRMANDAKVLRECKKLVARPGLKHNLHAGNLSSEQMS